MANKNLTSAKRAKKDVGRKGDVGSYGALRLDTSQCTLRTNVPKEPPSRLLAGHASPSQKVNRKGDVGSYGALLLDISQCTLGTNVPKEPPAPPLSEVRAYSAPNRPPVPIQFGH